MQEDNRSPSPEELRQMEVLVEKAMQAGAVGLSTGLIYVPGTYAKTGEVIALAKAAAKHGGIYASHIRSEEKGVLEAIREAIQVGEEAQMPVEISHFKISSQKLWGLSDQTLALVHEARRQGLQVTVDQYAYTASSTKLSSNLIPSWVLGGGFAEAKRRILHPDTLVRITGAMQEMLQENGRQDYTYAVVANYKPDSTLNGKSIPQITQQVKGNTRLESQIRQVLDMYLAGDAQMVYHSMSEADVERILREPFTMFASDAGPGQFGSGVPHPRGYGNNARVLARYVREKRLISLEDAIRKMTSLPAQTFGLRDRGLIREGFVADLLLIDEDTVTDRATFEQPHQYATGIDYVIVSGIPVIAEGQGTGALPGKAIRKSQQVPGRVGQQLLKAGINSSY
jgi:N-acyl-D-amino-acid deacylase